MNTLDSLWTLTVAGSVRAGLLILAVLLLRSVLCQRVSAQCFHLLWLLVALRLFMPVAPGSAWSVFNLFLKPIAVKPVDGTHWRMQLDADVPNTAASSGIAANPVSAARSPKQTFGPRLAIPLVWMLGVLVHAALLARSALRMRRRLRGVAPANDPRLAAMLAECAARFRVSEKLTVIETDMVPGPAVMGLWRPRLLLPPGLASRLSDDELRFVLLHECAHLRRRDLLALWALTVARVLHWFNPLVWIAVRVARTDAELACDEAVLRETRAEKSLAYGEALLKLAQIVAWRPSALPAAGIVEGRRAMRTRLARIGRFSGKTRHHRWLTALIVIGVGVCFGADEKAAAPANAEAEAIAETPPEPSAELPEWARGWSVVWVSFPPQGSSLQPQVDLQNPNGAGVALTVGAQSDEGVKLIDVAWVNSPTATAVITMERAGERAVFSVSSEIVSRRGDEGSKRTQVEIQARFLEISETNARRLTSAASGGGKRDQTGIELLGSRLSGGTPAVQILTDVQSQEFLRALIQKKGVELLSAPSVTTKSGQRAVIEIVREFRYPVEFAPVPEIKGGWNPTSFETRNCGVTLEVEPEVNDAGAIRMKLSPQVVEFLGFRDMDSRKKYLAGGMAAKSFAERFSLGGGSGSRSWTQPGSRLQPVFSARKIETDVTLLSGSAVLIVGVSETENAEGFPSRATSHRLAVLISANTINPQERALLEGKTPAAAAPAPPLNRTEIDKLLFGRDGQANLALNPKEARFQKGTPVPDRPGFVTSPFASESGAIDVRGFPPGTQVRCPFSGKTFLVP
ncbi:MAG: M56 family metallopeptidase [Chthoniobacteraceae bacterium]